MTESKPAEMIDIPTKTTTETADQERDRILAQTRHRVAMLLDELKAIFLPHMMITFLARDPGIPDNYTFLTEETDKEALASFIKNMDPPEKFDRAHAPASETAS